MFALRQNASRISLHLLTWLKEMLTKRERRRFGFSAGGGGFQKENTANPEILVHKARHFARRARRRAFPQQTRLICNYNAAMRQKSRRRGIVVAVETIPIIIVVP
jgi:hypothetical protein